MGEDAQPSEDALPYFQFFQATTRAEAKARTLAAKTLRSGMLPTSISEKVIEIFSETRLNKDGKEYTYTRKTERELVRTMPGDWRAAEAYLKRRDPDQWSEKFHQEFSGTVTNVVTAATLATLAAQVTQWEFEQYGNSDDINLSAPDDNGAGPGA
jgi:hypothetical protein